MCKIEDSVTRVKQRPTESNCIKENQAESNRIQRDIQVESNGIEQSHRESINQGFVELVVYLVTIWCLP